MICWGHSKTRFVIGVDMIQSENVTVILFPIPLMKVLNISWRPASVGRYQASAWNTGSSVEAGFDEAPQCRKSTSQPPLFQIVQDQNGS